MKFLIAILTILLFNLPAWAFDNSLTITTYYPSPRAVYGTVRFSPNDSVTPDDVCPREGEISFHANTHELYVCQGSPLKWTKGGVQLTAQSGLGVKNDGSDLFSPSLCDGSPVVEDYGDILCDKPFYRDIVFTPAFNETPVVMVSAQHVSGDSTTCASHDTDKVTVYAELVTKTGFRIRAGGSPPCCECGNSTTWTDYKDYYTRAVASWIAIGE